VTPASSSPSAAGTGTRSPRCTAATSRAFAINAIAGLVLAELLVASLIWPRLRWPAVLGGLAFAASTLVAYALTRTSGLLGFHDDHTITEAVIAVTAEIVALGALGATLLERRVSRTT
jgi:hypothetical protein